MKIILENKPIERISARTNLITSVGLAEKWAAYGSLKLKKKNIRPHSLIPLQVV